VIPEKSWIDGGNRGFRKVFRQFSLRKQMRCLFCTGLAESFQVLFGSGTEWWTEMHLLHGKTFEVSHELSTNIYLKKNNISLLTSQGIRL